MRGIAANMLAGDLMAMNHCGCRQGTFLPRLQTPLHCGGLSVQVQLLGVGSLLFVGCQGDMLA